MYVRSVRRKACELAKKDECEIPLEDPEEGRRLKNENGRGG